MDVSYLSTAQVDQLLFNRPSCKYSTLRCLTDFGILASPHGQLTEYGRNVREILLQSATGIEDIAVLTRAKALHAFRGMKGCYSDADSAYKRGLVTIARYQIRKAGLYAEIVERYLGNSEYL